MKKRKLFIMACSALIAAGLCSCGETTVPPIDDAANPGIVVHEAGIKVRKLSEGTDTDGKPYIVVGYTLTPSDTTHVHFFLTVAFQNENAAGTATDYVTATIDESAKTVKIKKVQDFDEVVVVTITDLADTTKKASVEVHLKQKFLGWPNALPADFNNHSARFQDSSHKYVQSQSSNKWWYGLQYEDMSPHDYVGNGFSTTYTDAMTSEEKAVTVASATISTAKYYALSNATETFHQVGSSGDGYYSISSSGGSFVGDGSSDTQNIGYVPEYGSLNPKFVLKPNSNQANLTAAVRIDTASWTNSQKAALAAAEAIKLTVTGTLTLKIGTAESAAYPFTLDFYAMNSDYYNLISDYVPLTSIQAESSGVTF